VFSLKGGVGTSTIAVNLAVAIKRLAPSARVGLIDLSFEQGHDALLLDIVPTSTILDWAKSKTAEATPQVLNQYFVQHRSGISLLAAPMAPEDAEMVRPETVRLTLSLSQQAFDYIVVDTASTFSETTLISLEMAASIVVPLTPDMAALKSAVSTKRILTAVRIPEGRTRYVLNTIVPSGGLSKDQIESSLQTDLFQIPHGRSLFMAAANQGMPATTGQNPPPAARAIVDLARTVCEPEEVAEAEPVPRGVRARLFRGGRA
jgi:pilus assembly protein CpaE